jgi:hypothetical protein
MNYLPVRVGNDSAVDLRQDATGKQISNRLRHVRSQQGQGVTLRRLEGWELIAWDLLNFELLCHVSTCL